MLLSPVRTSLVKRCRSGRASLPGSKGPPSMQTVGIVNWHRSEDFAPLMLVMSGQEKHRLIRSLGEVAEALVAAAKTARAALIRAAEEAGIPVIAVVH